MEVDTSSPSEMALPDGSLLAQLVGSKQEAERNLDEFLEELELLPYLEKQRAQTSTWPGHPTLIAKVEAGIWKTESLVETTEKRLVFPDPARHYDVHFELQVSKWKRRMALYVHYETAPYYSEVKLRSRADRACVEQYYQRRNEFIQEFRALEAIPGFTISPGTVQIGKAEYNFDGKTAVEVAAWITPIIDEVGCAVNLALFRVDQRRAIREVFDQADAATNDEEP